MEDDYLKTKQGSKPRTILDDLTEGELKALAEWDVEPSYHAIHAMIERITTQSLKVIIAKPVTEKTAVQTALELAECKGRYEEVNRILKLPELARAKLKQTN